MLKCYLRPCTEQKQLTLSITLIDNHDEDVEPQRFSTCWIFMRVPIRRRWVAALSGCKRHTDVICQDHGIKRYLLGDFSTITKLFLHSYYIKNGLFYWSCYPPLKAEGYRFGVIRPTVRPSGCPSVRPSVTNLFRLYFKDYYRFEHETSGVYRSHWEEVYCKRTITLHILILELLPFVFILEIWSTVSCKLLRYTFP